MAPLFDFFAPLDSLGYSGSILFLRIIRASHPSPPFVPYHHCHRFLSCIIPPAPLVTRFTHILIPVIPYIYHLALSSVVLSSRRDDVDSIAVKPPVYVYYKQPHLQQCTTLLPQRYARRDTNGVIDSRSAGYQTFSALFSSRRSRFSPPCLFPNSAWRPFGGLPAGYGFRF